MLVWPAHLRKATPAHEGPGDPATNPQRPPRLAGVLPRGPISSSLAPSKGVHLPTPTPSPLLQLTHLAPTTTLSEVDGARPHSPNPHAERPWLLRPGTPLGQFTPPWPSPVCVHLSPISPTRAARCTQHHPHTCPLLSLTPTLPAVRARLGPFPLPCVPPTGPNRTRADGTATTVWARHKHLPRVTA